MKTPNFKTEDVWRIASALLDIGLTHDEGAGRCTYTHYTLTCPCCYNSVECNWQDVGTYEASFKHTPNCEMLIAQDILTNAPDEYQPKNQY
jgi:hypothetical protein